MALFQSSVLLSVFALALCNDLRSGFTDNRARVIFEQTYDYKPSIYVRSETVNIDTHGDEIISQIEVVDKRDDKDGIAKLIAGGIGQKSVTISLKSPAVFRGMTFTVTIYAVKAADYSNVGNQATNLYNGFRNGIQRAGEFFNGGSQDAYGAQRSEDLNAGLQTANGNFKADASRNGVTVTYGTGNHRESNTDFGVKSGNYGYDQQDYSGQQESVKNLNSYTKQ